MPLDFQQGFTPKIKKKKKKKGKQKRKEKKLSYMTNKGSKENSAVNEINCDKLGAESYKQCPPQKPKIS